MEEIWKLLDALEGRVPFDRKRLDAIFASRPELRFTLTRSSLSVDVAPLGAIISPNVLQKKYPGGGWLPPPPPGMGPDEASGAYWVDRPWGQIWFAFFTGDRLIAISLSPGLHGSPGV